jgi:hypothetical protein
VAIELGLLAVSMGTFGLAPRSTTVRNQGYRASHSRMAARELPPAGRPAIASGTMTQVHALMSTGPGSTG